MKTMVITVDNSAKVGALMDTPAAIELAAQFTSAARAEAHSWASPLEQAVVALHKGVGDYMPAEAVAQPLFEELYTLMVEGLLNESLVSFDDFIKAARKAQGMCHHSRLDKDVKAELVTNFRAIGTPNKPLSRACWKGFRKAVKEALG